MVRVFDAEKLTKEQAGVVLEWLEANGFTWRIPGDEKIVVRRGWISAHAHYPKRNELADWGGYRPILLADSWSARVKKRTARVRVPFPSQAFALAGSPTGLCRNCKSEIAVAKGGALVHVRDGSPFCFEGVAA